MHSNNKNLQKYKELIFCSNKLIDGGEMFSIHGDFPIIIRKENNRPIISLKAINNMDNKNFIEVIKEGKSKFEFVKIKNEEKTIEIFVKDEKVLLLENFDTEKIEINFIDLRPIGLNIFGDKESLNVGGTTILGNVIIGANIFMNLG